MPEISSIWWGLLLLGLFAGVLSGMLGLGSGAVVVGYLPMIITLDEPNTITAY